MAAIKANVKPLNQVDARMRELPEVWWNFMMSETKRQACRMVVNFQEGIKKNNFQLERLKSATIDKKYDKAYPAPNRPLYGLGETDVAFLNMLRIRKLKYGWKVAPSWAKHRESNLPLRALLEIHEYGKSFVNAGGTVTRIPPRPAFRKAYERTLKQQREVSGPEVRKKLNEFIRTGKKEYFEKAQQVAESDAIKIKSAFANT